MNEKIEEELERLTGNVAFRREDLLRSGLRKSRLRKKFNILAGVLALLSGGAMTSVIADLFSDEGVALVAALIAILSGAISLAVSSYFSDEEIVSMLNGSSKYLALRESVYRLVLDPHLSSEDRFASLAELQQEYARLDESYSRYFSLGYPDGGSSLPPLMRRSNSALRAAEADVSELHRRLGDEDYNERLRR